MSGRPHLADRCNSRRILVPPKSILRGAAVAATLLLGGVPAAGAAQPAAPAVLVCNQASPHFQGGGLVALDAPVDSPAARYTEDLSPLPGHGGGLVRAAANSPALTLCDGGVDPTSIS
jgi:hypothetical protein